MIFIAPSLPSKSIVVVSSHLGFVLFQYHSFIILESNCWLKVRIINLKLSQHIVGSDKFFLSDVLI